jgi:hypothetical protein
MQKLAEFLENPVRVLVYDSEKINKGAIPIVVSLLSLCSN